ncbi:sulfatase [Christiangramia sp.]|uniref:sulfatase family protein n=1 Tax=Christiangramia sp. TaxID=1931228 RepID=UPI0026216841|nr:sulfatase [Christiangramia sp.]
MKFTWLKFKLFYVILLMPVTGVTQESSKPNIILVMADDLGYGDLESYGHPLNRTQNLSKMADEGMRFTSFYSSASTCTPARASLLTGRYPLRVGLPRVLYPEADKGLPADEITIAELLKKVGYTTKCVGKWHLGQNRQEFLPTSQGFDEYYGLINSNDMMAPWVQTEVPLQLYRDETPLNKKWEQSQLTADYTEEAVKFINNSAGENSPFFLYLPYNMPHVPIEASEKFKGSSQSGRYGDVIQEIDWSMGQILDAIKKNGVEENTIVLFLSDNGPWNYMSSRMFADDIVKPWDAGTTGLLRGGKINSYEGGFRVPLIMKWPAKIRPGSISSETITIMDLLPTLASVAGAKTPNDRIIDGVDFSALLEENENYNSQGEFYYFEKEYLEAIRSGPWKLRIAPFQGPDKPMNKYLEPELYNLNLDPSERINLAKQNPEKVSELMNKMRNFEIEGALYWFN